MPQKSSADVVPFHVLDRVLTSGLESVESPRKGRQLTGREIIRVQGAIAGARIALEEEPQRPGVMFTTRNRLASLLQSDCARIAMESGAVTELKDGALEATFDDKEKAQYAAAAIAAKVLNPRRFSWVDPPTKPDPLPDDARIAVFGDWATGLYGAPFVAESIQYDKDRFHLVLHLGDTYYAGRGFEMKDRLLHYWPKHPNAIYRSLNGNHEMYSKGKPYLNAVRSLGQSSSCFWAQNESWTLIGLDTSYCNFLLPSDFDLYQKQIPWIKRILKQAGKRKVLLFSHHYLFSGHESGGEQLRATFEREFADAIAQERFFAWYWGHEHRCSIYDWDPRWKMFGRCVGHGGFPYFRNPNDPLPSKDTLISRPTNGEAPAFWELDGSNPDVLGYQNEYGPHGYMTLELEGEKLTERILPAKGRKPIWSQELTRAKRR